MLSGLQLDESSATPLYQQLFDLVVARIHSRAFPPGHRLPPTRALAAELGTHRNTVVRAYAELEAAGYVSSTVGRGTFVSAQPEHAAPVAARPGGVPWSSLVASHVAAEPLRRYERLAHLATTRDHVNLTRMQPSSDLLPSDELRRCTDYVLRTLGPRALGYAPHGGLPRLRELIAQDLARQGVPATPDDVLVTTGSQQALDLVSRALVTPGDTFLVDSTTYTGAINLLTAAGARLVAVPSDDDGPDLDALARLGRVAAKGFYLMPNCHNPTGATVSTARREALVAWSHESGVPLVEDDYGADLALDGDDPPLAIRALDGDVLYMGTFSKKLAPALRVGFLVCPPPLRRVLLALKHAMDLGTSALLQHVLAEFLERGYLRTHLGKTLPEYRRRRDALVGALVELPRGVEYRVPERGVVLWMKLPDRLDVDAVFEEAQRRGVLASPGSLNAIDGPVQGLRLTFCAESAERVAEGGKRLAAALRAVARQRGLATETSAVGMV